MDLMWLIVMLSTALFLLWLFRPYWEWWLWCGQALDVQVARASFHCEPGELIPPVWREPSVALSVVIPAYNEEYRLPQMLDETLTYLKARAAASADFTYEVVVVDDGSRDGTYAAAVGSRHNDIGPTGELRVMQLAKNRGKGFAVRAGMLAARGRLLLMADADGATSIRDLERLEQALKQPNGPCGGPPQVAFGSRHHLKQEAVEKRPWYRNILMLGFHFVVWFLVGGHIQDTQCGFKLFRADAGKKIFGSLHLSRWAFDVEILILANMLRLGVTEVPVSFVDMPGSKLNLLTGALTMLRDIALVRILFALGVWRPAAAA